MIIKSKKPSVGIFAETEKTVEKFANNIYLAYAIDKLFKEEKELQDTYDLAVLLKEDEKELKRLEKEINLFQSSVKISLVAALGGLEDTA